MSDCNCVGGFSNNCPVHAGNQERNPVAVERVTFIGYLEEIESLQAQNDRLVKALSWMVQLCDEHANRGAFSNGVTDPTGAIDEGDVTASKIIKEAKAVLEEAKSKPSLMYPDFDKTTNT